MEKQIVKVMTKAELCSMLMNIENFIASALMEQGVHII